MRGHCYWPRLGGLAVVIPSPLAAPILVEEDERSRRERNNDEGFYVREDRRAVNFFFSFFVGEGVCGDRLAVVMG